MGRGWSFAAVRTGATIAAMTAVLAGAPGVVAALPDGRAYELVSPPDKHGGDVIADSTRTRAAEAGGAVAFASLTAFADVAGTGIAAEYVSRRTALPGTNGWSTHGIMPRLDPVSLGGAFLSMDTFYMGAFAADLSKGVLRTFTNLSGDPLVEHVTNLYVRDDLLTPGPGTYELATPCPLCVAPLAPITGAQNPNLAGATPSFDRLIFESRLNLADGASGNAPKLYEWARGTLRLAGILPEAEGGGPAARSFAGGGAANHTRHALSDGSDGHSRIVFVVPPSGSSATPGKLYMRLDGVATVRLDGSERTPPDAERRSEYGTASADGTTVYFTTPAALTDDAPVDNLNKLYRYDASRPDSDPHNLTYVSRDGEPADLNSDVTGVLGASEDGTRVYFTARSQLVAGEETTLTASRIYLWHAGALTYVGALTHVADPDLNRLGTNIATGALGSRVAPDGRHLLLTAHSGVGLTGADHGNCPTAAGTPVPCTQLYLFDLDEASLTCASCHPDGTPPASDASFNLGVGLGGARVTSHLSHPMPHDGSRVFFTTGESLVEEDRNGDARDVYVYDADTGERSLLSSGESPDDASFLDASVDGRDVFLATRERLVGWDVDDSYDLYDARAGGGFPDPPPPPKECVGDACRGALPAPPPAISPASRGFVPDARNATRAARSQARAKGKRACRKGKARKRVKGRIRCVNRARRAR